MRKIDSGLLPVADPTHLGGVKAGSGANIGADGTLTITSGGATSHVVDIGPGTGSQTAFALPNSGQEELIFKGGAIQKRGTQAGGASSGDYYITTAAGTTYANFFTAPVNGIELLAGTAITTLAGTDAQTLAGHPPAYFQAAGSQAADAATIGGHAPGAAAGNVPVLDVNGHLLPSTLPPATAGAVGGVKPGTGLTVAADGTLNATSSGGVTAPSGGSKIQSGAVGTAGFANVTFPVAFSSPPIVVASPIGGAGNTNAASPYSVTTTGFSVGSYTDSGAATNEVVHWIAIGS